MTNFQNTHGFPDRPIKKGDWIVINDFGYRAVQATSVTQYRVSFAGPGWTPRNKVALVYAERTSAFAAVGLLRHLYQQHSDEEKTLRNKHKEEMNALLKKLEA